MSIACVAALMGGFVWAELPAPVVRWTMDSLDADGRIPDATGGGNALQLGPSMKLKAERFFGGASVLECDGTTDCWACSTAKIALASRTIAFWVYRPCQRSEDKNLYVVSGLSGSSVNCPNNGIGMRMLIGNKMPIDGAAAIGSWVHVVLTVDITSTSGDKAYITHNFFRNGGSHRSISDVEYATNDFVNVSQYVTLCNDTVGGTRGFYGYIRDVRVYDRALTLAEARELYAKTLHERPARPLGFWRMEDSAADATGEGLAINLGDGVTYAANGISGKALHFLDSSDAYGYVTNDAPPFSDISISMWMRPARGMPTSAEVNNTLVHLFTVQTSNKEYYRVNLVDHEDNGLRRFSVSDMATVDNSSADVYKTESGSLSEKGLWSHFAFVAKAEYDDEADEWYVTPKYYFNGALVTTGRRTTCSAFKGMGVYPTDLKFVLGNRGYPNNRAFWGEMDDVALFAGALTDDEVAELYRGVPTVDAGSDFLTDASSVRLAGTLSVVHTGDEGRAVAKATTCWSLVSAPSGGEAAAIEATDDLETRVTLPVVGAYTFRLTAQSGALKVHDDVVVTRTASSVDIPAIASVQGVGNAYAGIPYALKATLSGSGADNARVRWQRVSGPEAVLFETQGSVNTTAFFYQPGQYVLRAVLEEGAISSDVAVTVASATGDITDGLMYHVPFDRAGDLGPVAGDYDGYAVPWSTYYDRLKVRLAPGVSGYGIQVINPFQASLMMCSNSNGVGWWNLQEVDAAGSVQSSNKPTNPYRAFSCWIKYDAASDTNSAFHSVIVEQRYNLGLLYDRESGKDVFRMYQNNGGANGDGFDVYEIDDADASASWVHVYALFDRTNQWNRNVSELWVNGVRQTPKQKYMGYGRPRGVENRLEVGGLYCDKGTAGFNNHWADSSGNSLSRTFPGYIDEFRVYARNLNEAEIKLLAMHPAPQVNRPPAVNLVSSDVSGTAHRKADVASVAADDGMPSGSTLTGAWQVLSGDASKLTFDDSQSRVTMVTAQRAGTYVLAFRATDGARVAYSKSLVFEAKRSGVMMLLR